MTDCVVNLYGRHEKSTGQVKPRGTLQSFTMEFKPAFNAANDQRPTTNDQGPRTKDQGQPHHRMKKNDLKKQVAAAINACLDKKAEELTILEMEKGSGAFTDYFVLCSGTNPRQVQAIADEVEMRLKAAAIPPTHVEGYNQGEWILIDYVDFVVHVFSEKARKFYDLERLWKSAKRLQPAELKPVAVRRQRTAATIARRKRA
jgi:ribosome-associated protein